MIVLLVSTELMVNQDTCPNPVNSIPSIIYYMIDVAKLLLRKHFWSILDEI